MFVGKINGFDRDLMMPHAHIGGWIIDVRILIGRRYVHNNVVIGPAGCQQALHTWNNLLVDIFTGEWIAWTRPGISEINADQCGLFAKANSPLKAALFVNGCTRIKSLLQNLIEILDIYGHNLPLKLKFFRAIAVGSMVTSRTR